jgi:hypothetical protein
MEQKKIYKSKVRIQTLKIDLFSKLFGANDEELKYNKKFA